MKDTRAPRLPDAGSPDPRDGGMIPFHWRIWYRLAEAGLWRVALTSPRKYFHLDVDTGCHLAVEYVGVVHATPLALALEPPRPFVFDGTYRAQRNRLLRAVDRAHGDDAEEEALEFLEAWEGGDIAPEALIARVDRVLRERLGGDLRGMRPW